MKIYGAQLFEVLIKSPSGTIIFHAKGKYYAGMLPYRISVGTEWRKNSEIFFLEFQHLFD